jgi:hypothetical protein
MRLRWAIPPSSPAWWTDRIQRGLETTTSTATEALDIAADTRTTVADVTLTVERLAHRISILEPSSATTAIKECLAATDAMLQSELNEDPPLTSMLPGDTDSDAMGTHATPLTPHLLFPHANVRFIQPRSTSSPYSNTTYARARVQDDIDSECIGLHAEKSGQGTDGNTDIPPSVGGSPSS